MNTKRHYLTMAWILHSDISLVIVAVVMLLMTSCLLNISTPYYRPGAPGGAIVRAMEPRTNSVILFERQGVTVGVNTSSGYEDQLIASISFEVPDGKVFQLLEHNIEVSVNSKGSWKSDLSGWVWTGPGRTIEFPLDAPMIGKNAGKRFGTATGYGKTRHAAFFFKALLFLASASKTFKIKMPRFLVNNIEVELPIIEFTLDSEDLWTSLP